MFYFFWGGDNADTAGVVDLKNAILSLLAMAGKDSMQG